MSRKFERKKIVTNLALKILDDVANDPMWILQNCVKPKPRFWPKWLWAGILKKVIKTPKQ